MALWGRCNRQFRFPAYTQDLDGDDVFKSDSQTRSILHSFSQSPLHSSKDDENFPSPNELDAQINFSIQKTYISAKICEVTSLMGILKPLMKLSWSTGVSTNVVAKLHSAQRDDLQRSSCLYSLSTLYPKGQQTYILPSIQDHANYHLRPLLYFAKYFFHVKHKSDTQNRPQRP